MLYLLALSFPFTSPSCHSLKCNCLLRFFSITHTLRTLNVGRLARSIIVLLDSRDDLSNSLFLSADPISQSNIISQWLLATTTFVVLTLISFPISALNMASTTWATAQEASTSTPITSTLSKATYHFAQCQSVPEYPVKLTLILRSDILQQQVPGRRCPSCMSRGQTIWVIPGKRCPQCGTEVN